MNPGLPFDVLTRFCPKAGNEDDRLQTVKALGLETAARSDELDDLCKTMVSTFEAPSGLISFFLDGRGYRIGSVDGVCATIEWHLATCYWMLLKPHPEALVVNDLTQDARFAHTAYAELGLRAYMSCPLVASNGHRIGSICFADSSPRNFTWQQVRTLANFAELAVRLVEQHVHLPARLTHEPQLLDTFSILCRSISACQRCVLLVDVGSPGCAVLYASLGWQRTTGLAREQVTGSPLSALFTSSGRCHNFQAAVDHMVASGEAFRLQDMVLAGAGSASDQHTRYFNLNFRPAASPHLDEEALLVNVPGYVPVSEDTAAGEQQQCSSKLQHLYFVTVREASSSAAEPTVVPAHGAVGPAAAAAAAVPGLQLQQLLGVGTYGTVYRATWKGQAVAVKLTNPLEPGSAALRQALFEVQVAQRCSHPNIVATHTYALAAQQQRAPSVPEPAYKLLHTTFNTSSDWPEQQEQPASSSCHILPELRHLSSASAGSTGSTSSRCWAVMDLEQLTTEVSSSLLLNSSSNSSSAAGDSAGSGWVPSAAASRAAGPAVDHMEQLTLSSDGSSELPPPPPPAALVSLVSVLELCERGCLQDALDMGWLLSGRNRALAQPLLPAVCHTALEISSALVALHAQDVVHGDLSAFNVLLSAQGGATLAGGRGFVAKVADFGLSHSLDATARLRLNGYGTVTHMAPEVLLEGISSKAADVYSFGVLMWQLLTSSRPWAGLRHDAVVAAVAQQRAQLCFPAAVPPDMAALARACMDWEPGRRPAMGQVEQQLQQLVAKYCTLAAAAGGLPEDF